VAAFVWKDIPGWGKRSRKISGKVPGSGFALLRPISYGGLAIRGWKDRGRTAEDR